MKAKKASPASEKSNKPEAVVTRHICCICNMAFAIHDATRISFIKNEKTINFCCGHLRNIVNRQKCLPPLPQTMPRGFNVISYLQQVKVIITRNSLSKEFQETLMEFLEKTGLSELEELSELSQVLKKKVKPVLTI